MYLRGHELVLEALADGTSSQQAKEQLDRKARGIQKRLRDLQSSQKVTNGERNVQGQADTRVQADKDEVARLRAVADHEKTADGVQDQQPVQRATTADPLRASVGVLKAA